MPNQTRRLRRGNVVRNVVRKLGSIFRGNQTARKKSAKVVPVPVAKPLPASYQIAPVNGPSGPSNENRAREIRKAYENNQNRLRKVLAAERERQAEQTRKALQTREARKKIRAARAEQAAAEAAAVEPIRLPGAAAAGNGSPVFVRRPSLESPPRPTLNNVASAFAALSKEDQRALLGRISGSRESPLPSAFGASPLPDPPPATLPDTRAAAIDRIRVLVRQGRMFLVKYNDANENIKLQQMMLNMSKRYPQFDPYVVHANAIQAANRSEQFFNSPELAPFLYNLKRNSKRNEQTRKQLTEYMQKKEEHLLELQAIRDEIINLHEELGEELSGSALSLIQQIDALEARCLANFETKPLKIRKMRKESSSRPFRSVRGETILQTPDLESPLRLGAARVAARGAAVRAADPQVRLLETT